jgi:MFS family permease
VAGRRRLFPAGAAVLLAAADTYVVVVALPSIMGGTGLDVAELQRATPIITGFLLGYVALLPLLGRLSDLHGRRPVFIGCLITFAAGSVITATAQTASVVIAGRAVQGVGGGGLVPVTLALVAEMWPPEDRGLPLGIVGAVQELGSVLGPLYGAAVVELAGWRTIFWLNLPLAGLLALAFVVGPGEPGAAPPSKAGRFDVVGAGLVVAGGALVLLALWAPSSLANSVSFGQLFSPEIGGKAWVELSTPLMFIGVGVLVAFAAWETLAPRSVRPVLALRRVGSVFSGVDLFGALLLAGALACIVVVFSTSDPAHQVLASSAPVVLPLGAVLLIGLVLHQRRSPAPLIQRGVLSPPAAWGSMLVNLAVGAALMAALVDVPFFARSTVDPNSQIHAALVLIRFLVAVPVGAVLGGLICRRRSDAGTAAAGMILATVAFLPMTSWSEHALSTPIRIGGTSIGLGATDLELIACGLGFGLAIAPINAAVLRAVRAEWHGLATAFTVVARMVGMLIGLSVLTAIGLRAFYQQQAKIGTAITLCPNNPSSCPAYNRGTETALLTELHTIFGGAAICAALAAVLALLTLRVRVASSSEAAAT